MLTVDRTASSVGPLRGFTSTRSTADRRPAGREHGLRGGSMLSYANHLPEPTCLTELLRDVDPLSVAQPPHYGGPRGWGHRRVDGVDVVAQVDRFLPSGHKCCINISYKYTTFSCVHCTTYSSGTGLSEEHLSAQKKKKKKKSTWRTGSRMSPP